MGTSGPVTNPSATSFSSQKKLVTLSTGRMVAVVANTSKNAQFLWSDDGHTWTDYAQDIINWSNGSIAVYVDGGGIERLVAVWKENNLAIHVYIKVGTFNSGRTTITWGTVLAVQEPSVEYDYPDVVVNPEGTGARSHVVFSRNLATANYVWYAQQTIDSSGVITVSVPAAAITATYGVNLPTNPSIDINPITKDLYCAWMAGAAGAGKGIRFRKAAYSAGVWTWAAEVEVDNTLYNATTSYWVNCRWDGTRVIIGGCFTATTTTYFVALYQSTNFTSFGTLFRNSVVLVDRWIYGTLVIESSGDVYFLTSSGTVGSAGYYKWTRATSTLELRVITEVGFYQYYLNATYSGGKIRWIYVAGNNSPYQVKYDELVVVIPAHTGSASGSTVYTGSATGKRTPKGSSTGSTVYTGSATGKRVPKGSSIGSIVFTASATGARTSKGSASGSTIFLGSSTGTRTPKGSSSGETIFVGSATGKRVPKGSSSGSTIHTGSSSGIYFPLGLATGSSTHLGTATGKHISKGSATGTATWFGSATGKRRPKGLGLGSTTRYGTAVGNNGRLMYGHGIGETLRLGSATGIMIPKGFGEGSTEYVGHAIGTFHYVVVTASLLPRRWEGTIQDHRRWEADILSRRWEGHLL